MTDAFALAEVQRLLVNMIRAGRIVQVDHGAARCVVSDGAYTTGWRPWIELAGRLSSWTPPTVGEQVILLAPAGDLGNAVVLRGLYSDARPAPDDNAAHDVLAWENGTVIRHDAKTGTLYVQAQKVVVTSPDVHLGEEGGERVARIGDRVEVGSGSSAGLWPIVEGSERVRAGG